MTEKEWARLCLHLQEEEKKCTVPTVPKELARYDWQTVSKCTLAEALREWVEKGEMK